MTGQGSKTVLCAFAILCAGLMIGASFVCFTGDGGTNDANETASFGAINETDVYSGSEAASSDIGWVAGKDYSIDGSGLDCGVAGASAGTSGYRFWCGPLEYEVISGSDMTCKVVDYDDCSCGFLKLTIDVPVEAKDAKTGVTYKVTEIGDWALSTHLCFKTLPAEIRIYANIEKVGASAFSNAHGRAGHNTKLVEFCTSEPSKLSYIGPAAFEACNIESIELPASVKEIGQKAFYKCSQLREVKIGEGASDITIGRDAFYRTALEEINLEGVTSIGYHAFYKCSMLQDVNLSSIRDIGFEAFNRCDKICHVVIGNDLQSTDGNIFSVSFFDKEQKEIMKDPDGLRGKEFRGEGSHLVLV